MAVTLCTTVTDQFVYFGAQIIKPNIKPGPDYTKALGNKNKGFLIFLKNNFFNHTEYLFLFIFIKNKTSLSLNKNLKGKKIKR